MMDLIITIQAEREEAFQQRLMGANADSRAELIEIREGMAKRDAYMRAYTDKILFFETAAEKLQRIQEWYPRTYRILQRYLPGFIENPNDMPPLIAKLADSFTLHMMLPADHRLLSFAN